jgi:hypothetical protein
MKALPISNFRFPIADFQTFGINKNWQLAIGNWK